MHVEEPMRLPLLSNPRADRVHEVAKLARRPVRSRRREFLVEGPQTVREALRAHRDVIAAGGSGLIREMYAVPDCLDRYPELEQLVADLPEPLPVRLCSDEVLAAMAGTVSPQGVIAVCCFLDVPLEAVLSMNPRLLAVLCRVQDPGNAGTVIRAADAAGADAVVFVAGSVDVYNPKLVRSTAGSLFHVPVVLGVEAADLAMACRESGLGVLAADGYGALDLDELQDEAAARSFDQQIPEAAYALEASTAWLFGNEAQGLSDAELRLAEHRVAVPVYGAAESLNVGTAATVCLYASARAQRRSDLC